VRRGAAWTSAAILVLTIGFASPVVYSPLGGHAAAGTTAGNPPGTGLPGHLPNNHIEHVVTIMLENHGYDSYFGTYCQVLGPYCSSTGNGIPANTCVPYYPSNLSYGCIVPFNLTPAQFTIPDMAHDWYSGGVALDHGAMDRFYEAEGTTLAYGHYNATTIPVYWDMAEEYASSDNFWGANLSWSLPNHWYLIAATTPPSAYDHYVGFSGIEPPYLDESNATSTIQDLLNGTAVTWKYYDTVLQPYDQAVQGVGTWGTAYDLWNPMAGRHESYTAPYVGHFVPRPNFVQDVKGGRLPNVSWVMPDFGYSDHPGSNNSAGEEWVAQLVNTVENSSYWNSTAIFVTWDDYGGWYDHVAPPSVLGDGFSFRAPVLVISPYAKENYISHVQLSFMSLLRFVEWEFGLGCLRPLDCFAPLPLDFFDFGQPPRAPMLFRTTWDTASYPIPRQSSPGSDLPCEGCLDVTWTSWAPSNASLLGSPYYIDYS